ncbi:HAD domain-containing protein [Kitasatospora sp. NPDC059463]|uniref:HAD domain-containing protein n=1 Tax=unclassified Kitasatospora TaxID=2633591 RepID=UPI0036B6D26C
MPKPLLFLDVDGVLNPVCPAPEADFDAHTLFGYTVLLSARHGTWLRELAGRYELVWATTWEEHANTHILPLMELLSARKWAPLLRYAAGRPFAWVDDVIPPRLVRNSLWRRDRLLLAVDPGQGLERHHVDRLLARPPRPGAVLPLSRWAAS